VSARLVPKSGDAGARRIHSATSYDAVPQPFRGTAPASSFRPTGLVNEVWRNLADLTGGRSHFAGALHANHRREPGIVFLGWDPEDLHRDDEDPSPGGSG